MTRFRRHLAAAALLAPALAIAQAPMEPPPGPGRQGKLLLTGGVSSIDGAAGGGLTPWAVIAAVPPGPYRVKLWHPEQFLDQAEAPGELPADAATHTQAAQLNFAPRKRRPR